MHDPKAHAALQTLLEPGEELRLRGDVEMAMGDNGPLTDWVSIEQSGESNRFWTVATRTWPRKLALFTVLSPFLVLVLVESIGDPLSDRIERLFGGVTCVGPRDSRARMMQHVMTFAQGNHMAISDRRLLLLRRKLGLREDGFEPVWSVPLREIASAAPQPRGPLRRRLRVAFIDGSHIVIALPTLQAPPPARVAATMLRLDDGGVSGRSR